MLVELETDDWDLLQRLVERYQKLSPETEVHKITVIRRLIRHASALKTLPLHR